MMDSKQIEHIAKHLYRARHPLEYKNRAAYFWSQGGIERLQEFLANPHDDTQLFEANGQIIHVIPPPGKFYEPYQLQHMRWRVRLILRDLNRDYRQRLRHDL